MFTNTNANVDIYGSTAVHLESARHATLVRSVGTNSFGYSEMTISAGPYQYRPIKYDDWGTVRAKDGEIVCYARAGWYHTPEELDEHRRNKTDPYEDNARLFSASYELFIIAKELKAYLSNNNIELPPHLRVILDNAIDKVEGKST